MPPWLSDAVAYWPTALIVPGALAAGALTSGYGPRLSRSTRVGLGWLLGGATVVGLFRWQLDRLFNETPEYEVEQSIGELEVRRYPSMVHAETTVKG